MGLRKILDGNFFLFGCGLVIQKYSRPTKDITNSEASFNISGTTIISEGFTVDKE